MRLLTEARLEGDEKKTINDLLLLPMKNERTYTKHQKLETKNNVRNKNKLYVS